MRQVALASHYYHTYRRFLLSILIITGFLSLISTIFHQLNPIKSFSSPIGLLCKIISVLIFILLLIEQSPWTYLLYPALVCVHIWISGDFAINWIRERGVRQIQSSSFWIKVMMIGIGLQAYILPFFHRWTMSIGILFLLMDAVRRWHG
jgi:hypothetical protein